MAWEYRGIKGGGSPPPYLSRYHGDLIVMGSALCVWDDYQRTIESGFNGHLMAVNDIGQFIDKSLEHWVSLHPKNLVHWVALARLHATAGHGCLTHTNEPSEGIRVAWDIHPYAPTSGLYAIQVGLVLGYDRIMLCGVPQDNSRRIFDPPWMGGGEHQDANLRKSFRQMVEHNPEYGLRVRSQSGWTKELLGDSWH